MLDDNKLLSVSVELTPAERALMVKYGHPLSRIESALKAVASSRARTLSRPGATGCLAQGIWAAVNRCTR